MPPPTSSAAHRFGWIETTAPSWERWPLAGEFLERKIVAMRRPEAGAPGPDRAERHFQSHHLRRD